MKHRFILIQLMVLLSLASIPGIPVNAHMTMPPTRLPLAAFTYNPCVMCAAPGDVVFFSANTSWSPNGHIASYTWNFGDNSTPFKTTSPNTVHDFLTLANPGRWNVTLTIQDTIGASDTITQLVIFNIAPRFTYHPTHPMIQQTIIFNASSSHIFFTTGTIKIYQWSFGDKTNATGIIAKHAYMTSGTFRVALTLQTSDGNPTITQTITVFPRIIIVNKTLDGLNITVTGIFTVNATAQTVSGSITMTATNATTGAVVFTNTFDITLPLTNNTAQFILTLPATIALAATCQVDQTGETTSSISRDPDITHRGSVDIMDAAALALSFGTTQNSPMYNASADLNGDGQIDIMDASTLATDFGTPVLN